MTSFFFPILGYLCGSLPFSVWITRLVKGVDVRDGGSGHAGATNTVRQAGFGWGALVFVLDLAKGFFFIYFALGRDDIPTYIIIITAICAVIGHCFPIFAQFRGGMGLATAGGCLLAINPLSFLVCLGLIVLCVLIVRHAARASVLMGVLAAPALWILNIRDLSFWAAMGVGSVIALRFLINWNRQYRELWLDRERAEKDKS
jgi:glycerol-3-phosphate acyltransferase PlsY